MAPKSRYETKDDPAEDAADAALEASRETLEKGAEVAEEVSSKASGLLSKVASGAESPETAVASEVLLVEDITPKKTNPFRKEGGSTTTSPNKDEASPSSPVAASGSPGASLNRSRSARVMSPEEKAKAAALLANASMQSASEFDALMSERLPDISTKLDYKEAKQMWKESAVTDINGKYISVCGSGYAELEPLGPGIGLWFRTLKALCLYFTLMSLLVAFIVYNAVYLYYNDNSDMDEDTMQILARVTTGVVAATTQSDTFRGWDMKMIMLIVSCIDVFVVLCYLLMIAHLKRRQEAYVEENDDAVVSLPDYSVMVWGIPKDADEDSMISHFTQFGELADCVIVKDLGKVMGPRIRRAKQLDYLKNMKIQAKYYEIKMYARGLRVQLKRIERYKKRILRTNAKIEKKLAEGFDAVCAFITFQEPEARAICVDSYNEQWSCCHKEKLKYRGKHKLRIKPAPEASDILWENVLRKNPLIQILRKFISFLVILVLCAAAVAVLVYAKDAASDSPPTVSCATVEPSVIAPSPALHCSAIWNLAGEDAYKVADSQARLSIDKFVDNVDINSCRNFISGAEWVRDMREFSAGNYSGAKNANLPAESSAWTGGFIADSYADECAALTCKKCFCLASVDVTTMLFDYVIGSSPDNTNFCKDIYDQMALETAVVLSTIAMTTATNMILMASAHTFSKFERHKTISATETNCAKYTFAALVVNQAIAPVIIYSYIEALEGFPILFQGQYGDFETAWYNKVMVTIMSTAMVNIVAFPLGAALPNIAAAMLRSLTGCCAPSQKKLNEIYAPAEFSLARRYGQMLCGLFYTIVFLCAAPPLAPLAAILFGAMYITDKWLLLKFSKRPPMYDHKLNTFFLKTAPYAGWVHLAIASWAFGYHEIPSYIVDPGGIAEKIGFSSVSDAADAASDSQSDDNLNGAPGQFDILARLVRANALVPFLMFVIVTVALFFTGLIESIASFFGNACVGEEKVDEVPPFDELVFFGDSRYDEPIPEGEINNKLSGLRSYRLEDNPEYMQLFPEVLAADGAESLNRKKRPTALGETAAPERQNMTPGA